MSDKFRITIKFDETDERGLKAFTFLNESCGRNKGEVIALAMTQFIEKYNFEGAPPAKIKKFVDNYDFICSEAKDIAMRQAIPMPYMSPVPAAPSDGVPSAEPVAQEETPPKSEDDIMRDMLNDLVAGFNINT